jgi:asparagine synthase (glutamine-hydrolysing)
MGTGDHMGSGIDESYLLVSRREDRFDVQGTTHYEKGSPIDDLFAEWDWDGERLRCQNDRYGFRPLFYFERGETIGISPSVTRLLQLGAPAALDVAAVSVFLRLGFFLGNDTPFTSIRALPPGAFLSWNAGKTEVSGGYPSFRAEHWSRNDAIDAYIDLLRAAILRSLPQDDHFAVPLSGGRDSRHILLELLAAGAKPKICPTVEHFPPRANSDAAISARLAEALKVKHRILPQPSSRLAAELKKNVLTGFCSDELSFLLPLASYLPKEATTVYDGLAGDILSAGHLQDDRQRALFASRSLSALAELMISYRWFRISEPVLRAILTPESYGMFDRRVAIARITEELERHCDAPNPAASFFFWNRTRREIALSPLRLLTGVSRVICPYLSQRVCDFLLSLPAKLTSDRRFHTDAILRAHPTVRHIPFAQSDTIVDDHWFQRRFALEIARYSLFRTRQMTSRRSVVPRLFRTILDGHHQRLQWLQAPRLIWLLQLDDVLTAESKGILGTHE